MIVVQINSECGRGSTGKIACAISNMLSENGIENYIYYSGNHKSTFPNSIQINNKLSIRIHQILSRIFGDQGFHSTFSTVKMVNSIRRIKPDVILLHNIHGYYLHIGILFKFLKKYNKPVLWTLHDCWAFTGHCTHFIISKCDRWKDSCGQCRSLNNYPYSLLFDRSHNLIELKKQLYGNFDKLGVITPSKWLLQIVKQSFLKNHDAYVINNGINTDVFHKVDSDFKSVYGIENKVVILGVASVWSYAKGIDIFIKMANENPDWQIVLVGTDENVDKSLPNSIISIHRTSNQNELVKIYSAADVFVNPTREDTFPTVNLEAIACGVPVVTFNTGGCSETVQGYYAAVCECNYDSLISSINHVLAQDSENDRSWSYRPNMDLSEKERMRDYYDLIMSLKG